MIGESSQQGARVTQCFRCQDFDLVAALCPTRTLLIEGAINEDDYEEISLRMALVMPERK